MVPRGQGLIVLSVEAGQRESDKEGLMPWTLQLRDLRMVWAQMFSGAHSFEDAALVALAAVAIAVVASTAAALRLAQACFLCSPW